MRVDKHIVASMNRQLVLETIWEKGPISKAEITRLTALSLPTVIKIMEELVRRGVIASCGKTEGSAGKRAEQYVFAGDAFYSIGIDMTPTNLKVVVIDLNGRVLGCGKKTFDQIPDVDSVLNDTQALVLSALADSAVAKEAILDVGVAVPGILDTEKGMVLFSPNLRWENVDLLTPLRERLFAATGIRWELQMENSNRTMALGEQYYGSGVGSDYFICINLGYGIGAAAMEHGELYKGISGTAGELGHITVEKDGPLCTCGNNGCLEALASGRAIAQQARNLISSGVKTSILELTGGDPAKIEAKTVFEAAEKQDMAAVDLVRKAGEYIGIGIASYINLLDPEIIVLGGGMSNEELLIEQIEKVVKVRRMRFAGRKVQVRVSELGEYATAIGAAAIQLKRLLRHGGRLHANGEEEAV